MKLSNIFNIKTNTGGGNKLFTRIMNKYNVPKKEYIKVKDKLENFSGGGDSGSSDVEYWKVNDYDNLEVNDRGLIYITGSMFKVIDVDGNMGIAGAIIAIEEDGTPGNKVQTLLGFMFNKTITITPFGQFTFNSFVEYLELLSDQGQDRMNILEYLTPITKEEFYDLNNI